MSTCILLGCLAGVWALLSLIGSERAAREPHGASAQADAGGAPH